MTTDISLIETPIFIVAAGRSGSTHLRLMLDRHPDILCMDEIDYTVQLLSDNEDWPELNKYYEWLETNRIFLAKKLTIDRQLNYPQLVNSFLSQQRDRDGKRLVCAVVHHDFDKLLKIWPNAYFIHLVRDGRDVAYSCVKEMNWYGNFWKGIEYWQKSEKLWSELREIIPVDRRLEITYESLMSQTVKTLTQICVFLGVSYDRAMLSYPQTTTYSLPDTNFIGLWQHKMSKTEIQLVESRISEMLTAQGYQLSGLPLIKVNSTRKQWLKLQDWWKRVQFRIKRIGLSLFLSDYLSRHLGFKEWQKSIKLKINAINTAYLK